MFGQPIQTRLSDFDQIPVIDISGAHDPTLRPALVEKVISTAEQIGFMYIVGHGIGDDILDGVFDMSRQFFDKSDAEKRDIHITKSREYRGYLGLMEKGNTDPTFKGNNLEAFHCATELGSDDPDVKAGMPLRGPNLWPENGPDGFRNIVYSYYDRTFKVGITLLELFAEGLGQPIDFFTRHYRHSLAQLRLLKYAQIDDPNVELLARSHCDTGMITILSQDDTGGLEVLNKSGEWIPAPPMKGAYIINIGNTLQFWSGGRFSSTNHRVANRGGVPRYSIPFFMTPDYDTVVRPLGSENDPNVPTFHVGKEMMETYRRIWPSADQLSRV